MTKKAILAVSFGTTHRDAYERAVVPAERAVFDAFPGYEHKSAFTSRMVVNALSSRGVNVMHVSEAFEKLKNYDEVIAVSEHIINGFEYEKLLSAARLCCGSVKISRPLISRSSDYDDFIRAVSPLFCDADAQYIFMGHGSGHFADSAYAAMDYRFKDAGFGSVHVATVEGYPALDNVLKKIHGSKKAVLMPMMLVAGDHAKNDMANGWAPRLEDTGIKTECVMKGLGEYGEIRGLLVKHALEAEPLR